jgi:DNA repair exonuclease SbcCD nuclease subunit
MNRAEGARSIRLVLFSDPHLDWSTHGVVRYEDVSTGMERVRQAAVAMNADAVVCLGDIANPERLSSHRAVARCIAFSRECYPAQTFWLTGNHDVIEDGSGGHVLQALAAADVEVWSAPTYTAIEVGGKTLRVMALPYTPLARSYSPADFVRACADEDAKRAGDPQWVLHNEAPMIVFGHLMLEGIGPGSETRDMPRGRDVMWPLQELAKHYPGARLFAGHYHNRQVYRRDGCAVHVVGSLCRLVFPEEGEAKGWLEVEIPIP